MNEICLPEIVAVGSYNTRHAVRGREVTRPREYAAGLLVHYDSGPPQEETE